MNKAIVAYCSFMFVPHIRHISGVLSATNFKDTSNGDYVRTYSYFRVCHVCLLITPDL
jgi:hypothetical protein